MPANLCLDGHPWAQLFASHFWNFPISRKKRTSGGDLGQCLLGKFTIRLWIRRGVISCAPHTSFDEINDSVVGSEHGELVRGSDLPLVYSTHTTAGDMWRAPTMRLLQIHLAAGVWKSGTKCLDRLPMGKKMIFDRL